MMEIKLIYPFDIQLMTLLDSKALASVRFHTRITTFNLPKYFEILKQSIVDYNRGIKFKLTLYR